MTAHTDWLWHFLQRVPADEALLRAMEARFVAALDLPSNCQNLRDQFGRGNLIKVLTGDADAAIYSATRCPEVALDYALNEIQANLSENGQLILFVDGGATSAETQARTLNDNHFIIERWLPYYDEASHKASANLTSPWPQRFEQATGHYVPLPWRRFLDPFKTALQPHFDADSSEGTHCLLFIARKSAEPILQELPPSQPFALLTENGDDDNVAETESKTATPAESASQEKSAQKAPGVRNNAAISGVLIGLALLLIFFTLRIVAQGSGSLLASALPLGLAAAALSSLGRLKTKSSSAPNVGLLNKLPSLSSSQLARAAIYGIALIFSFLAQTQSRAAFVALPLWLIAIALAFYALYKPSKLPVQSDQKVTLSTLSPGALKQHLSLESIAAIATVLIALALRFWNLTTHPWILNGIETQMGLEAMVVSDPFASGWLTNPTLPLYLTKGSIAIFGRTALALRLLSPLIGSATVLAVYLIGHRLWSARIGLLAAILLATSHTHIHYSRLGMTNIWDPLLVLLALGGIAIAWQTGRRSHWLAAAAAVGMSAYFFTALHLLPLILLALSGLMAVGNSAEFHTRKRNIGPSAAFAFVIALPLLRVYQQRPVLFMERATILSIDQSGWLARQMEGGLSASSIYLQQLWQSLFSFSALIDTDASYKPGVPLVNTLVGILLIIGLGMAIAHFRQPRFAILLLTFLVTVIFGGALLVDLPHSRRLIIALPAIFLLAAIAADWLLAQISLKRAAESGLVIVILFGLLDVGFYFGRYQSDHTFADRNTEVAHGIATYLTELDGNHSVYLYGAPQLYVTFSTIPFLAENFRSGINLHDVLPDQPTPQPLHDNIVYLFTPDHFDSIPAIMEATPGGKFRQIEGFHANPLLVAYEISSQ